MAVPQKGLALVQRCEIRKARNNSNYASMTLYLGAAGNHGSVEGRIWDSDRVLGEGSSVESGTLVEVHYRAEVYQGRPQWVIEALRVVNGSEREAAIADFTPPDTVDREFYETMLDDLIASAIDERVATKVMRSFFLDPALKQAFIEAPAATRHHQAYRGGLLEHTLNVTLIALALADAYGQGGLTLAGRRAPIDRNLILCAGLIHDFGKIRTYEMKPLSETTDANRFEGHLSISYAWTRERCAPFTKEPPYPGAIDEINKLLNCVLSHHGQLEFGSPVTPACIEAFLLSQADMTDARVAAIVEDGLAALDRKGDERWVRPFHYPGGMFVGDWKQE